MRAMVRKILWILEKYLSNVFYRRRLIQFKGVHDGQRCFIIGNGPSLVAADLELIKNEHSFAANSIFKIFEKTSWRPTYYVVQDAEYARGIVEHIPSVNAKQRFISMNVMLKNFYFSRDDVGFYLDRSDVVNPPRFSHDFSERSYEGFTVLYSAMQLAIYMGFKEIYLLGVDFKYSAHKDNQGNTLKAEGVANNHFFEAQGKQVIGPLPNLQYSGMAYQKAEEFSKENGIKIFNCTRGGELEAFERRTLEYVLSSEK